jgi:type II secretory pathway predicted ATPase ExeA
MYLELFKLTELPFRLSPDPAFLYLSKHHARAKAYMESTIWFTDGFVVITGEIGSGKTTLIETFLRELGQDVVVAQVNQTQLSPTEFLQLVLVQFGFTPFKMKKAELLATINTFLIEQYASGRKVVLIIDEAQNLSDRVLEEVRLLSGIETTKEKVLRIILAGQPELNEKLNAPEFVQLAQRVRLRFHLTPLSQSETRNYIEHRLEVAGDHGRQIFADDTFDVIFRYTGGVPRLINSLCDTAMMSAYSHDANSVTVADIEAAVAELQWVDYMSRTNQLKSLRPVAAPVTSDHPDVIARILIAYEGQTVAERQLLPGRFIIGRTPDNDLQIDSKYVSRHHCQIISTPDGSVIEDLNSTNGIYVKQKRARKHNLNDGDVVLVGKHELMYIDERHSKAHSTEDTDDVPALNKKEEEEEEEGEDKEGS